MTPTLAALGGFLVTGVLAGALSAAFGVGGASVSTPAIRALGVPATLAVATTLPSVIPGAIVGSVRYMREGLVEWSVVRWTVPVGVLTAVGGSLVARLIPGHGHLLMLATAAILGYLAWRLAVVPLVPAAAEPGAEPGADPGADLEPRMASGARRRTAVLSGVSSGLLSGVLGLGGGIVLVPAFTETMQLPLRRAIATSLVCVGAFAVPSTIAHGFVGDIDWVAAGLVTLGAGPGARIGAVLALRTNEATLRRVVALGLGGVAVAYGVIELLALR